MTSDYTLTELASLIERFSNGDAGPWEWDNFISVKGRSPLIEAYRSEIAQIPERYPTGRSDHWCSEEGLTKLRQISERIRQAQD